MAVTLYVANAADDTISIIPTRRDKQQKHIQVGTSTPNDIVAFKGCLFCSHEGYISKISYSGKQLGVCGIGSGNSFLYIYRRNLYALCSESNSIWRIHTKKMQAQCLAPTGEWPIGLVSEGERLLVVNMLGESIWEYDTALNIMSNKIELRQIPLCAAVFEGNILVSCLNREGEGNCTIIGAKQEVLNTWKMPWPVHRIVALKSYYALMLGIWHDQLMMVNIMTKDIVWIAQTKRMPYEVVVDETDQFIYVSCLRDDCVEVFHMDGTKVHLITTGREPRGITLIRQDG